MMDAGSTVAAVTKTTVGACLTTASASLGEPAVVAPEALATRVSLLRSLPGRTAGAASELPPVVPDADLTFLFNSAEKRSSTCCFIDGNCTPVEVRTAPMRPVPCLPMALPAPLPAIR